MSFDTEFNVVDGRRRSWNPDYSSAHLQDVDSWNRRNSSPHNLSTKLQPVFTQDMMMDTLQEYPPTDYENEVDPLPDYDLTENNTSEYLNNRFPISHSNNMSYGNIAREQTLSEPPFQIYENLDTTNDLPQDTNENYTLKTAVHDAQTLGLLPERTQPYQTEPNHISLSLHETTNINRQCWGKSCRSSSYHVHTCSRKKGNLPEKEESHLTAKFDVGNLKFISSRKRENKFYLQCKDKIRDIFSHLKIWQNFIKQIEGHFGTSIASYFVFVRWLLFLNVAIFIVIFLLIVLPQILVNNSIVHNSLQTNSTEELKLCSSIYWNSLDRTDKGAHTYVLDFLQGTGWMESTLMFIGSYENICTLSPIFSLPLAYLITIIVVLLLSLVLILRTAAHGVKEGAIVTEGQFHNYCNTVFAGWDFCIMKPEAADLKSEMLTTELMSYLENEKLYQQRKARTRKEKILLYIIRIFINLFVCVILCAACTAIFYASEYSLNVQYQESNSLNSTSEEQTFHGLIKQYMPSITITLLNIIVPVIFYSVVLFEKYSPGFVVNINLVRTVVLRLASIGVLLYSFETQINTDNDRCGKVCLDNKKCSKLLCWETHVGQQIYKLLLMDFFVCFILIFIVGVLRMLLVTKLKSKICIFIGQEQFDIPTHVLDLVYSQTLCWLGIFFSPLLSIVCIIKFICFFYMKKFHLTFNCIPSRQPYRASKSNYFFMIVLLLSFAILVVVPLTYTLTRFTPSKVCSPFRSNEDVIWEIIPKMVISWPFALRKIIHFITSAGFAIPVIIILLLIIYYYFTMAAAYNKMSVVLKEHLHTEGKDKQFLLQRLNDVTMKMKDQINTIKNTNRKNVRFRKPSHQSENVY